MSEGKFLALWTKYLPVIRIVLKKSLIDEQQIMVGKMELQSVDNRKNASYVFSLEIVNGRIVNGLGGSPIGKDLFFVLNNDTSVINFMSNKRITMKMGKAFQLTMNAELLPQTTEAE
jgi:hypothetical protein